MSHRMRSIACTQTLGKSRRHACEFYALGLFHNLEKRKHAFVIGKALRTRCERVHSSAWLQACCAYRAAVWFVWTVPPRRKWLKVPGDRKWVRRRAFWRVQGYVLGQLLGHVIHVQLLHAQLHLSPRFLWWRGEKHIRVAKPNTRTKTYQSLFFLSNISMALNLISAWASCNPRQVWEGSEAAIYTLQTGLSEPPLCR